MLLYCFLNSICKIQFLAVINFYFIAKAFFSYWQYFVRLLQPCSMRHLENFFYYFGNNNQRKCNCVECCFLSKKFLPGNLRVAPIKNTNAIFSNCKFVILISWLMNYYCNYLILVNKLSFYGGMLQEKPCNILSTHN